MTASNKRWVKVTISEHTGGMVAGLACQHTLPREAAKLTPAPSFEVDSRNYDDDKARRIIALVEESGALTRKGQLLSEPCPSTLISVQSSDGNNTCRFQAGKLPGELVNLKLHLQQVIGGE